VVLPNQKDDVVVKSCAEYPRRLHHYRQTILSVYDILNAKKLVVDQAALAKIEEVFA
jgi:large subunit ribosomal protein L4